MFSLLIPTNHKYFHIIKTWKHIPHFIVSITCTCKHVSIFVGNDDMSHSFQCLRYLIALTITLLFTTLAVIMTSPSCEVFIMSRKISIILIYNFILKIIIIMTSSFVIILQFVCLCLCVQFCSKNAHVTIFNGKTMFVVSTYLLSPVKNLLLNSHIGLLEKMSVNFRRFFFTKY